MDYLGNTTLVSKGNYGQRNYGHAKASGPRGKGRLADVSKQVDGACVCVFWIGFATFVVLQVFLTAVAFLYTLPILLTVWLPILLIVLIAPCTFYCCMAPIIARDREKLVR